MICLTGLTFTGQAGIIGHTILMGGAVMADIFIRALPKYAPDLIVLLGLYLLLLGRWKKQGRRPRVSRAIRAKLPSAFCASFCSQSAMDAKTLS